MNCAPRRQPPCPGDEDQRSDAPDVAKAISRTDQCAGGEAVGEIVIGEIQELAALGSACIVRRCRCVQREQLDGGSTRRPKVGRAPDPMQCFPRCRLRRGSPPRRHRAALDRGRTGLRSNPQPPGAGRCRGRSRGLLGLIEVTLLRLAFQRFRHHSIVQKVDTSRCGIGQ